MLLRASVIAAVLYQNHEHWQQLSAWMKGLAILVALAVAAGYQTPLAAAAAILFHSLVWSRLGVESVADVAVFSLDALALALLGPGAYSVDGYRFGRRLLVLPSS